MDTATMKIPNKVVVYRHYGQSVYVDGMLAEHFNVGNDAWTGIRAMCRLLGIPCEARDVRWEDWPGQATDSGAVHRPPKELAVVERHFAELAERRRVQQIANLEAELFRLRKAPPHDA